MADIDWVHFLSKRQSLAKEFPNGERAVRALIERVSALITRKWTIRGWCSGTGRTNSRVIAGSKSPTIGGWRRATVGGVILEILEDA